MEKKKIKFEKLIFKILCKNISGNRKKQGSCNGILHFTLGKVHENESYTTS